MKNSSESGIDSIEREYREWLRFQRSYRTSRVFACAVAAVFLGLLLKQGWFAFQLADVLCRGTGGWSASVSSALSRVDPRSTYLGHEVVLRETLRKMQTTLALGFFALLFFWSLGRKFARQKRFWEQLKGARDLAGLLEP